MDNLPPTDTPTGTSPTSQGQGVHNQPQSSETDTTTLQGSSTSLHSRGSDRGPSSTSRTTPVKAPANKSRRIPQRFTVSPSNYSYGASVSSPQSISSSRHYFVPTDGTASPAESVGSGRGALAMSYLGSVPGSLNSKHSQGRTGDQEAGQPFLSHHANRTRVSRKSPTSPMFHPMFDDSDMIDHGSDEEAPHRRESVSTIEKFMMGNSMHEVDEVDEVQRTVKSMGGISIDTQDSDRYKHAPFLSGNIQFVKDSYDFEFKKHYMCVPFDTPTEDVVKFMSVFWRMRSPKIVLSLISDVENFKPWKNQKLKDDFQKGIIKAANTTEMWIITNGVNGGVTKMLGDAIKEEQIQQINSKTVIQPEKTVSGKGSKHMTVIGIVPKDMVAYGFYFDGSEGVKIKNEGHKPDTDIYELNPDHTHFILVEDEGKDTAMFNTTRCAIEKQFEVKFGRSHKRRLMSIGSEEYGHLELDQLVDDWDNKIPVVGLLVQGSPRSIDQVLFYLQNKMPVLILKGSGGISDILAYAFEEIQDRGDPDFEENFLKPELIKMIVRVCPKDFLDNELAKYDFRDKIVECVKLAVEGDQTFLTIVNVKGWGSSLKDLDKYILRALFSSEKYERSEWREQLQSDLHLTMDWNRPDLASDIFQRGDYARVRIDKRLLEKAFVKTDREDFVELFLDQGCRVHKFLNHRKLKLLFEKAEDRDFFINVCLLKVLGLQVMHDQPLGDAFLSENLNRLIYKLSGVWDFIQPYELSMSSTGLYVKDPSVAERKALNCLIVWAVLMNRDKLAKALWKRTDEPIGVALVCSRIYRELAKFPMEIHLRTEMERNANHFGQMALGVLAICFRDSSAQAYGMLSKCLPDFNNKSVIEIAHDAGYIHFIAHPCCQKWLTKQFFGALHVKELDWGIFRLPYWFKILVSAFLIFPMNIWITFSPASVKKKLTVSVDGQEELIMSGPDENSDEDDDGEDDVVDITRSKSIIKKKNLRKVKTRLVSALSFRNARSDISFFKKIYYLWTAPITKFWTTQLFYFMYLGLFCLATLWPTCGNFYLDLILWFWTVALLIELVSRTYMKYHKYKNMSLVGHAIEIFLIIVFLVLLLLSRIFINLVEISHYIRAKTMMCFALLYFFYRLMGVYLPISPTLGPMLLRFNRMIKKDFIVFIRMFLIFMISGGVTIQAVLYPNYPLGVDMIKRVLTRPLYGMFLTQVTDLDGDPSCTPLYDNLTEGFCSGEDNLLGTSLGYTDPKIQPVETCPYSSLAGYVITLQYIIICKLVLITLLFAMFALTISQIDMEASEIWKFQRYALIADFTERFSLPPPFTIFSFLYLLVVWCYNKLVCCKRHCSTFCCCCRGEKMEKVNSKKMKMMRAKRSDDYSYWKKCAREYITCEETKSEKDELPIKQGEILVNLQEDLRAHRKSMKRLSDRVVELERMIQSSRMYLEDIAHKLDKTEVMGIANVKGTFIHVAARQSPYPSTRMARFPVFDKYVPWEMSYEVYDPKTFSLPKDQFPETEVVYVDEDMIELKRLMEERSVMTEEELEGLPPLPNFKPVWNSMVTFKQGGARQEIDRRSWITADNQPLRYTLDALDLPQNPSGRTGMRGKGVLWRWGPNHVIKAVVTRWRRKYGPDLQSMTDYLYVEGKRVLEFIAVQKTDSVDSSYGLPGDVLHGLSNPYSILCKAFMTAVFDESDSEQTERLEQGDMIQFFSQFATHIMGGSSTRMSVDGGAPQAPVRTTPFMTPLLSESRTNLRTEMDQQGFSASLLYKGYLDDPRNTDNAWVEAEVWNFHYDLGDNFDIRLQEESSMKWKEVSPYVKLFGNEGVIVQEAARIHDAYH